MRVTRNEFGREDAVPKDVFNYFSKYKIRIESVGMVVAEACTFMVLDPNVAILAHQRVPDSHPEAATHLWAARITLPGGSAYRILFSWDGSFLFLLVRPTWNELPTTYSQLIKRAREVEEGARPGPDLSLARVDFERFLEKHRELWGPPDVIRTSGPYLPPQTLENEERNKIRRIREYRRLA
ncbi:MAG TPA: hypothetical protein VKU80_15770, partial [Planctomycetota bacterium]|nr:hypothetical protein [Planctomycetota bacterium]